jgi:hypothetical protein
MAHAESTLEILENIQGNMEEMEYKYQNFERKMTFFLVLC